MIASELAKLGDGQRSGAQTCAPSLTQSEAAEQMQVSRRSVQAARQVQEKAPDLAAKAKSGELKVSRAAAMARERTKPVDPPTDPDQAAAPCRPGGVFRLWGTGRGTQKTLAFIPCPSASPKPKNSSYLPYCPRGDSNPHDREIGGF
jgi:hypothetical protein